MNPSKLKARAKELRDAVAEGDAETIDAIYTVEERKQIKKQWPLLFDVLEIIDDQIEGANETMVTLETSFDVLDAMSDYVVLLADREMATAPIEIVDAQPLPEDEE